MEEARPIVQRVALLACSITSVSVRALKCALFGSLRSGRRMAQATSIYGRNMAAYALLSGHVQSAAYLLPYLYI